MARRDSERFRSSKLPYFSRLKLKNIFPGEWESIYVGEGIEYAASKPYEPGDDLRDLDLQTLVQSGEEEIILREVGRQRKIYLWVDLSGSMQRFPELFFSRKPEIRDLVVGLAAFSAGNLYSPIGLCVFDSEIRRFFPAKFGESYCVELVEWFLEQADTERQDGADIPKALGFMEEQVPAQSLVMFVSDFQDAFFDGAFGERLRAVSKRFDFVPVVVGDPLEREGTLPQRVVVAVQDSERDRSSEIELTPPLFAQFQQEATQRREHLEYQFLEVGLEAVWVDSPALEDCYRTLAAYFDSRKRTRR